jgi:putative methyltransferase (TIGR04325 family)
MLIKFVNLRFKLVASLINQKKRMKRFFLLHGAGIFSRTKSTSITYEGIFSNFQQVEIKYSIVASYTNQQYLEKESRKINQVITAFDSDIEGTYRDRDLLLMAAIFTNKKLRILDIGAGFGLTYLYLSSNLETEIEYTALELKETVEILNDSYANYPDFKAVSDFQELGEDYEVVYFGSSLQYFEDYRETLNSVSKLHPSFILISDTPIGHVKSFVTAQVNMEGRVIPRWVFSLLELQAHLETQGYRLVGKTVVDWHQDIHNFENFPAEYHHIRHMNLIFRRF